MLENSRSDGTMILMGAAAMFFTTLLPRLSSYAFSYALHTAAGLVALSLGPDAGSKAGRLTNFAGVMVISLAVAYKSEVGRRYWPAAALARAQRVVPIDALASRARASLQRKRRENLLLAWRLRQSRVDANRAGACAPRPRNRGRPARAPPPHFNHARASA